MRFTTFTNMLGFGLTALFMSAGMTSAVPLSKKDVVDPTILSPNANTVWVVGQQVSVTWETDNLPPPQNITNIEGMVVLGFMENGSENLNISSPLAKGFNITSGSVSFTVPDVLPKTTYFIVLFGDSGNNSPTFTITSTGPPGTSSFPETISAPIPTVTGSSSNTGTAASATGTGPITTTATASQPASVATSVSIVSIPVPTQIPSTEPLSSGAGTGTGSGVSTAIISQTTTVPRPSATSPGGSATLSGSSPSIFPSPTTNAASAVHANAFVGALAGAMAFFALL